MGNKIKELDSIYQELIEMDLVLDDGRDDNNFYQNRRFCICMNNLDDILKRLLSIQIEGLEGIRHEIWNKVASPHMNLPEEKYNSAIRYIVEIRKKLEEEAICEWKNK